MGTKTGIFDSTTGIFGRPVPTWILGVIIITATAGAAAGTVLAGNVQGQIPTTVGQSLVLQAVGGEVGFGAVSDNGTSFTAANEIRIGEDYDIDLDVKNESDEAIFASLVLDIPAGLTVDVNEVASEISGLTRTDIGTWVMKITAVAAGDASSRFTITVAHADDAPPGFYQIAGSLTQGAF